MDLDEKLQSTPKQPGVYLIKDAEGEVLYVGKAQSLRPRLRQHFREDGRGSPWQQLMIQRATDFDFIVTRSDVEALILEANLIKEEQPQFNIRLADDKSYPYIKLTDEKYPRLMLLRDLPKDARPPAARPIKRGYHDPKRHEIHTLHDGKVFGPYPSAKSMRRTMRLTSQLFGIRSCRQKLTGESVGKPCLNYHIHRCVGACTGKVSDEEYAEIVRQAELFLAGKSDQIAKELESQMEQAASNLEFEKAAMLRDKLMALRRVLEEQIIVSTQAREQDVIAAAVDEDRALVVLMTVRVGKLISQQQYSFAHTAQRSEAEVIEAFITQHYSRSGWAPKEVLVSAPIPNEGSWSQTLSELRGSKVQVRHPQRGEKRRLVELAASNAQINLLRIAEARGERRQAAAAALQDLAEMLRLPEPPPRIECYDISNIQGQHATGSMVVFTEGLPDKQSYRHFKMRQTAGKPDDYAMMGEMLRRRLYRGAQRDEKFLPLPDLVLVDGGKGQLGVAIQALQEAEMEDIPVTALAKREEEVFLLDDSEPIDTGPYPRAHFLLQRIRDEAHRFALQYHRGLRDKAMTRSVLDEIPGIGPRRRQELLKAFPSVQAISQASVDELAAVPTMNRRVARTLVEYLSGLTR